MRRDKFIPVIAACAAALAVLGLLAPAARAAEPAALTMQQVLAEFQSGRWQQAASLAAALATRANAPEPRAWIVAGAALEQLGQSAAAAQAYQAYMSICPDPAVRTYVGEKITRCQAAAETAVCPSACLTDAQKQELAAAQDKPAVQATEHFEVRSPNAALTALLADLAEQALKRVTTVVLQEVRYPHSVVIEVHRTLKDYTAGAPAHEQWSGGRFELTVDAKGQVRRVIHLVQLDAAGNFDPAILDRVLPHELCHLVLTEWFGADPAPLYLQEGLAVMSEFAEQDDRIILAGTSLATARKIGLEDLTAREQYDAQELPLFYAQSYSLLSYLHQRLTAGQFSQVLQEIRNGCTLDESLQRALTMPQEESFLTQLAEAWQDHAIAHAQFLLTLRGGAPAAGPAVKPAQISAAAPAAVKE